MKRQTWLPVLCLLVTSGVSQGAFKFTAWADNRPSVSSTNLANFHHVVLEMNRIVGSTAAFHVVPGDYDNTSATESELNTYATVKTWNRIAGNHDTLDLGMASYVVDQEDVRLIFINEYSCPKGAHDCSQGRVCADILAWIEEQLVGSPQFVFVVGHEPAYPQGYHIGDSLDLYPAERDAFWQFLNDRGVLAYICGHTHIYSTFSNNVGSTVQIDAGNAGNPSHGDALQTFVLFEATDSGYVQVTTYRGSQTSSFTSSESFSLYRPQRPPQASLIAPADGGITDLDPDPVLDGDRSDAQG